MSYENINNKYLDSFDRYLYLSMNLINEIIEKFTKQNLENKFIINSKNPIQNKFHEFLIQFIK